MPRKAQRYTIYDRMEQEGVFEQNPANVDARTPDGLPNYKKAEFPMMVYHPEGKQFLAVPGEILATPLGPRKVGEQWRLIDRTVSSEEELKEVLAAGWHKTPAAANAIRNGEALPKTQSDTIEELETKIKLLELERNTRNEEVLNNSSKAPLPGVIIKPKQAGA